MLIRCIIILSKVIALKTIDEKLTFDSALQSLENIDDLNSPERSIIIKVGVFNPIKGIYTSLSTLEAIVKGFNKVAKILIAESDSYGGPALDRLNIWKDVFSEKVIPFNLTTDKNIRKIKVADEIVKISHSVFKPNVFVSTHVPRRYERTGKSDLMNTGSILKNLLGLIPDIKKHRFHEKLPVALLDIYEGIEGIDLAVLDATRTFIGVKRKHRIVETNLILIGRDAISVEAVGAYLAGFDPLEMPIFQEAITRDLGEANIENIEIIGTSIESARERVIKSFNGLLSHLTR